MIKVNRRCPSLTVSFPLVILLSLFIAFEAAFESYIA